MRELRLNNYNMAAGRLLGGILFIPLLGVIGYFQVTSGLGIQGIFICLALVASILIYGWMAITVVIYLMIGEQLTVCWPGRTRHYPLDDIVSIKVEFTKSRRRSRSLTPAPEHLLKHMALKAGKDQIVKVSISDSVQIRDLLRERGLGHIFQN